MPDWVINLIVGLSTAILGFISGFFTKSHLIKIKQKANGKGNIQSITLNSDKSKGENFDNE